MIDYQTRAGFVDMSGSGLAGLVADTITYGPGFGPCADSSYGPGGPFGVGCRIDGGSTTPVPPTVDNTPITYGPGFGPCTSGFYGVGGLFGVGCRLASGPTTPPPPAVVTPTTPLTGTVSPITYGPGFGPCVDSSYGPGGPFGLGCRIANNVTTPVSTTTPVTTSTPTPAAVGAGSVAANSDYTGVSSGGGGAGTYYAPSTRSAVSPTTLMLAAGALLLFFVMRKL